MSVHEKEEVEEALSEYKRLRARLMEQLLDAARLVGNETTNKVFDYRADMRNIVEMIDAIEKRVSKLNAMLEG